jgi:hypothetical protein
MCVNSESLSNEIDESDLQCEKHDEQRIWTWRGIGIYLIDLPLGLKQRIRITSSVAAREGKKTEEGTMTSPSQREAESQSKSNPITVADPSEAQILTPATTEHSSYILTNRKIWYWEVAQILRVVFGGITYICIVFGYPMAPRFIWSHLISSYLNGDVLVVAATGHLAWLLEDEFND